MPYPESVRIVLVEPESPGNIGAAARAMKTMGLTQLWLVKPACDPQAEEAYCMGHNAADILLRTRVVHCLEAALEDTTFSVATTQRPRRQQCPFYTPEEVAPLVLERGAEACAALVFGRESSGLTNEEVSLCSVQSTIPAATNLPAINLSQAVMIYAYAIFRAATDCERQTYHWRLARHAELEQFYARLAGTLERLGARPASTMDNYIARFRRVLGRTPLESRDVKLLHNLLTRAERGPG